jgi:glycosyltransferase involved in cell wall biosynthesis
MHVAHVNLARGFRGGERQTELLVRELSARGVEQTLVGRRGGALVARVAGTPHLTVRGISWPYLPFAGICRGADLIHAHEGKAQAYTALAAALARAPYVITRRIDRPPGSGRLTRAVFERADALVGLSEGVRTALLEWGDLQDVRIIPSAATGLPVEPARVAEIRARFEDRFLVVCAAALVHSQKAQGVLIETARRLEREVGDLVVLLLGRGSDEALFREQARGLGNVVFGGFVENLGDYLAAADLFVLPSFSEGLGSVILDAFEAGLPVLSTRIPGVVDIVRDGENGLLVPAGDPDALAQAMRRLRADAGLRERLAAAGRALAPRYSAGAMADRYLALYRELLDRAGPSRTASVRGGLRGPEFDRGGREGD